MSQEFLNLNQQPQGLNFEERQNKLKKRWLFIIVFLLFLVGVILFFTLKTGLTFSKVFNVKSEYLSLVNKQPVRDNDRINILILGLRGEGDMYGGLLTDAIILLSIKKSTGQMALISIPRDLYVDMPFPKEGKYKQQREKINFAYALGVERLGRGGGLTYGKAIVSEISNLYLDFVVAVDFTAFQKIVDYLGGIAVELKQPFSEESQFSQEFLLNLPAGKNVLDGKTALYYVRSRYSTNDFDRARRQQEVLLAIKEKMIYTGILSNPVKFYDFLETFGAHIKMDISIDDMRELLKIYPKLDFDNVIKKMFSPSFDGLLYSSQSDKGAYILLPVGDNFDKIQQVIKGIFR